MTKDKIKEVMDACYQAKRIRDMLPALPGGVTPSHIHYLDTLSKLEKTEGKVKVSDISENLGLPRPSVTKTVKDMEKLGFVEKETTETDGRFVYIKTTRTGRDLVDKYVDEYFGNLSEDLGGITDEDADKMIEVVEKFYIVMSNRKYIKEDDSIHDANTWSAYTPGSVWCSGSSGCGQIWNNGRAISSFNRQSDS